jgi:hypothetical protein
MSQITVLRPDAAAPAVASVELAERRPLAERPVIALIANGKPGAKEILEALMLEMSERLQTEFEVIRVAKPSAAYVISVAEADEIAARAHMVVSGLGD